MQHQCTSTIRNSIATTNDPTNAQSSLIYHNGGQNKRRHDNRTDFPLPSADQWGCYRQLHVPFIWPYITDISVYQQYNTDMCRDSHPNCLEGSRLFCHFSRSLSWRSKRGLITPHWGGKTKTLEFTPHIQSTKKYNAARWMWGQLTCLFWSFVQCGAS